MSASALALQAGEIALRVAVIYAAALALLRLVGRRAMGQLRPIDFIAMLLLSEALSPALTGGDDSLGAGLWAAAVLMGCTKLTALLAFRFRAFDHALDGPPRVLVRDGEVDASVMRSERITDEELRTALHAEGLDHVGAVKRAFVEPDGEITIVKKTPDR